MKFSELMFCFLFVYYFKVGQVQFIYIDMSLFMHSSNIGYAIDNAQFHSSSEMVLFYTIDMLYNKDIAPSYNLKKFSVNLFIL